MKSLTFKILIISIIFCVSVSCERKYEEDLIDSYFGERCYFDSVNPKYPMKISIDKKYYYMNNQYFKRLTIIDELYDNDTIVDYYIRFDGKKILSYIGENSKDKFFIDFNYNNYKSFKTTFEIRSFLAYNMVKIENTDTIVVF
jgi:hypothetical protein